MSMYDCPNCDEKICSHTLAYMDRLEEKNKILKEALEYYANRDNWGFSSVPKKSSHLAWIISSPDCGWDPFSEKFIGGKTARITLEKAKELK